MQFEVFYCQKNDFTIAILHELNLCSYEMIQLHLPCGIAQGYSVPLLSIQENETSIKVSRQPVVIYTNETSIKISRQPVIIYTSKEFEKYLDKPRSRFEVLWGILKNGRYR